MIRRLFTGWLLACGAMCASADASSWSGEVGGDVRIAALGEAGLAWKFLIEREGLVLAGRGPGIALEVLASPAAGGAGEWSWRVRRGKVDLAEAWPALRGVAGEAAAGWSASGEIVLAGSGTWSAAEGPRGEVRASLREGWARSDELDVELRGIELDAATTDLATGVLSAGQVLRVGGVKAAGAEVRDIAAEFGLTAERVLDVARVEAGFLGGRVRLKPFRVPLGAPSLAAAAEVEALDLAELAKLMPWAVAAASGRLRGRVELAWDETKGLRVRDGGLEIVRVDAAEFRLAPAPGMLTGDMPKKFGFFPASWRWARGLGFSNPAYAPLRDIEQGREGLRIETLKVTFWPDGPGGSRTATMHVVGRPTGGKLVREVVIDLNFHGPLTDVLAFGLNQSASYGFRVE